MKPACFWLLTAAGRWSTVYSSEISSDLPRRDDALSVSLQSGQEKGSPCPWLFSEFKRIVFTNKSRTLSFFFRLGSAPPTDESEQPLILPLRYG
jgi:hypothetical protein